MEQCRKTLEMDPNFAEAHHCLADSYTNKRMYKEAIAEFQKAVDLSKDNLTYVALLGNTYALAGRRGDKDTERAEGSLEARVCVAGSFLRPLYGPRRQGPSVCLARKGL